MMVSKPKPSGGSNASTSTATTFDVSENREKDIERRLALLGDITINEGDGGGDAVVQEEAPPVADLLYNPVIMEPPLPAATTCEEAPVVEEPVVEPETPAPVQVVKPPVMQPRPIMLENKTDVKPPVPKVAPAAGMGNKNALLARIMAVQEKAKQAQLKKAAESSDTATAPQAPISVTSYKEQMMEALNDGKKEDTTKFTAPATNNTMPPPPPDFLQMMEKPTATEQPAPTVAEFRDKMMEALNENTKKKTPFQPPPPPPPSFDVVEMQQQEQTRPPQPAAPPSFDAIEHNMMDDTVMPSAPPAEALPPPIDLLSGDHLSGLTSIVPPPPTTEQQPPSFETVRQQQPPSFETVQQQQQENASELYDFDLDGNPLTPEQKKKMMEEQRAILAQIQKSKTQDSASEAAARAVAFDMRSNTSAAAAATDTLPNRPMSCEVAHGMDGVEREVEQRSVDIGGGQKVALHGQEKTRKAIKEGTAVLVKCLNCDNWMQVTKTATLMFCPICSVVSPVVQADNAPSKEAITQMDTDRKLAEQLQKEEDSRTVRNRQTAGYPATRRAEAGGSWFEGLLPANMWSSTTDGAASGSAEINVTRPPGSSTASGGLIDANIGTRAGESNDLQLEQESLLGSGQMNGRSARAGRVAEQKPMFSCVVDSISSTANAMTDAMSSYTTADNDTVHGVDSSSFLSVTNATREQGDGAGSYRAVPE